MQTVANPRSLSDTAKWRLRLLMPRTEDRTASAQQPADLRLDRLSRYVARSLAPGFQILFTLSVSTAANPGRGFDCGHLAIEFLGTAGRGPNRRVAVIPCLQIMKTCTLWTVAED